ncbi:site-specific DNA-methyltransferase [Phycisphaerales bacterium AB-hyl4]|uniref:Methyltransferase n=1 Tax=Natronomicrosphaera hydrolytica TaxID=3242702 RepID=A0ABV4UBB8_9BACT
MARTRLALREDGWCECEELIWAKTSSPPLGSPGRPRRAWESILWYAAQPRPYADLTAAGPSSTRLGYRSDCAIRDRAPVALTQDAETAIGAARISDVLTAGTAEIERGIEHPAMMPLSLVTQLVQTFSRKRSLVLDPFAGSGTTLVAAAQCGRRAAGIEVVPRYARLCEKRLAIASGKVAIE